MKLRKRPYSRSVEFPLVKGRTVEKVQFFTRLESHSINIIFQDRTALVLNLPPGFTLQAKLESHEGDEARVVKKWRATSSERL